MMTHELFGDADEHAHARVHVQHDVRVEAHIRHAEQGSDDLFPTMHAVQSHQPKTNHASRPTQGVCVKSWREDFVC